MMDTHKTIGEVSAELGLTLRALRFYEDKGLVQPTRRGTARLYSDADVDRIKLFLPWLRAGLTIQQARQALGRYDLGERQEMTLDVHMALIKARTRALHQVAAIDAIVWGR